MQPNIYKIKIKDDTNDYYLSIALDMAPTTERNISKRNSFSLEAIIEIAEQKKEVIVTKTGENNGLNVNGQNIMYYPVCVLVDEEAIPAMIFSSIDNPKEAWITMFT